MQTLRQGQAGPNIKTLQHHLNRHGFPVSTDGHFGPATATAVRNFQASKGITADGIVGPQTWALLLEGQETVNSNPLKLKIADDYYPLVEGEYVVANNRPRGITLHHTVSAGSPYPVVQGWNRDNRKGTGTHFVIGGIGLDGSTEHDGKIIQCCDTKDIVWHLATTRMGKSVQHNRTANAFYIGIEVVSFGCLNERGGKFYTMDGTNREVPSRYVDNLETDWRTFKYWHKYSNRQVESIVKLVEELDKIFNMRIKESPYESVDNLCELSWDALNFRRKLTTHGSFEDGKFDIYPCPRLISALKMAGYK